MRISRLFTEQSLTINDYVSLNDKQSHYLTHVLRLKAQQSIILFNGYSEFDYLAQITKVGKKNELLVKESYTTNNESPIEISIFQALSKNEHMDFMVQKCTELGVNSIIIFNSQRTQTPLKNNKIEKKISHWKRIAQSACEQCGRSIVPSIMFVSKFDTALMHQSAQQRLMLDFEGIAINNVLNNSKYQSIDLLLGAEGGLTTVEIELAQQQNFKKTRLGPRVLRTETAAISAVSLIQMLLGDLN